MRNVCGGGRNQLDFGTDGPDMLGKMQIPDGE